MAPLAHPNIQNGWFRELNSQSPGQAMSFKVNKIIHTEKTLDRDILVFESEAYGNVFVVDGVVKCTQRDGFSYQEMIAHLPLASHPNPRRVLVIGAARGDGIVQEVLKHSIVEQIVLCDIDEAMIRASKIYSPALSAVLDSPKVVVHIGDSSEFLKEHESNFDVIIADSSDPVGPEGSLPYLQLLHDALLSGGHISTSGLSIWHHLELIDSLRNRTREIFPVSECAITTIPTSGQIGFVICSKNPNRDLKAPVREVSDTNYYDRLVHTFAFHLPKFGKIFLEEGRDVRPKFGRDRLKSLQKKPQKKILLLGTGFVARPCAEYVVRDPSNLLTIASRNIQSAQTLASGLPDTIAISLDVNDTGELEAAVAAHDLVISLIPWTYHVAVVQAAIKGNTHVVTTSYVSPAMRELNEAAREAGIVVMNEIGVDPGIDHLYAIKTIGEVHERGGKIKQFISCCGGLPAPECADNPLGYKFSWSARGVLLALLSRASYYSEGKRVDIKGSELMDYAHPYYISPAFALVAYPNRDSNPFREYYRIPEAETVIRSNLRYQGFTEFVKALVNLGWMDATEKEWLTQGLTWGQAMQTATGAASADEGALIARIKQLCNFPSEAESSRIISGLRWIGLLSSAPLIPRAGNLLDTLFAQLESLMKYAPGERDMVMLQHKFVIEWADGSVETRTSTLEAYGAPIGQGHSSMALTVGVPCGIAVQLILDGVLKEPGVHAPYTKEICDPLREAVEREGLGLVEKIL